MKKVPGREWKFLTGSDVRGRNGIPTGHMQLASVSERACGGIRPRLIQTVNCNIKCKHAPLKCLLMSEYYF